MRATAIKTGDHYAVRFWHNFRWNGINAGRLSGRRSYPGGKQRIGTVTRHRVVGYDAESKLVLVEDTKRFPTIPVSHPEFTKRQINGKLKYRTKTIVVRVPARDVLATWDEWQARRKGVA